MPSESAAAPGDLLREPKSLAMAPGFGVGAAIGAESVIALAMLPFAPLQPEPRDHDRREQERHHGGGDGGSLAEAAAEDAALVGECRHEMRRVDRAAPGHRPDELEVGE